MAPVQRVQLTFLSLVLITVVSAGSLIRALAWSASPGTALAVAVTGTTAAAAGGLALRILLVTHPPEEP